MNQVLETGGAGREAERTPGFVAMSTNDIRANTARLKQTLERLEHTAGRLLGHSSVPRNQREPALEKLPGQPDAPRLEKCETDQHNEAMRELVLVNEDLEELCGFMDQL